MKFKFNKKISILFVSAVVLILCVLGVSWLGLTIVMFLFLYVLSSNVIRHIKNNFFNKAIKGSLLFLSVLSVSIGIKLFWFDIYKVPSSSMENTIFPKDVILIDKLSYGPNIPTSPKDVPWINLIFYLNQKWRESIDVKWLKNKRLSGFSQVKNGDIVLFTMPFDNSFHIVKRCLAKGGDTLMIQNGNTYINGELYAPTDLIKNEYLFKETTKQSLFRRMDSLEIDTTLSEMGEHSFVAIITTKNKKKLEKLGLLSSKILDTISSRNLYPGVPKKLWNLDYYGPLVIPKKDMIIALNSENYFRYNKVINDFEGVEIEKSDDMYLINNIESKTYTFKQDYFFMMGDNRKKSSDSRFFGFVPKERIIGKAQFVLYSKYKDVFRWNRLLKPIN